MRFMNMWKFGARNGYFEEEQSGEQPKGNGGGSEPEPLTFATQADLDAYVAGLNKPPAATPPVTPTQTSIVDERKNKDKEASDKKEYQANLQKAVLFESRFESTVKNNSDLFKDNTLSIKDDVKNDDVLERASLIAATAAKEFFLDEENMKILDSGDQELVKSLILSQRYEQNIDGLKAWSLVERAIHNHALSKGSSQTKNFYGTSDNGKTGYANLDKATESFYPKDVVSLN